MPRDETTPQHVSVKKLFIGGVTADVSQAAFHDYFANFGPLIEAVIMTDAAGVNRGFGFVRYGI